MRVDQPRTQGEPQRRFISSPPSVPLVPYCRLLLGILGEFPAAQIEFFFRQKRKVEAFTGQRVVAVSAGAYHSLAITADGAVFTWGKGEHGCLGHGEDLSNQLLPKKVEAWAPGQ